jgi:hypothetical protein
VLQAVVEGAPESLFLFTQPNFPPRLLFCPPPKPQFFPRSSPAPRAHSARGTKETKGGSEWKTGSRGQFRGHFPEILEKVFEAIF